MKVVFAECELTMGRDTSVEVAMCPPGTEFVTAFLDHSKEDNSKFYEDIADADVLLNSYIYFGKKEIDALKHCKCISLQATGYNEIDMEYATQKGICVASILDYCTQETAENAFTLMLCVQRAIMTYNRSVQIDRIWDVKAASHLQRIEGQVMGIAGLGRIGQSVARKALGFGMSVIAYDPFLPPEIAENMGVKLVDKDTLLSESDVISIHMNATPDNVHFLAMDDFKKMKKHPVIVNEGRGPMVSEDALVWALDNGVVRGAGLDMLEQSEFPDLTENRLLGRENVIITPHAGYFSDMSDYLLCKLSMENALLCYEGRYKEAKVVRNGIGL
ncbi:MAG: C-terminal binding protein [Oscillospiraceae bacterium]